MKTKTIKAVLRKKIDEWLSTIDDPTVRELASKNTIVTGGCITSMLLQEDVNDFDIYFRNKATASAVANYYVARFQPKNANGINCKIYVDETDDRVRVVVKSAGIASEQGTEKPYEYFEQSSDDLAATSYIDSVMNGAGAITDQVEETEAKALEVASKDYRPVFLSTNAITLSDRIQLILRFWGSPDEIHTNYDFVHATNYWTSWDSNLVLRIEALEAILAKELKYVGSKYPLCSIIRMRKFINRGWSINAGQILKMALQLQEFDLTSPSVLEEQLTGVDVAYFSQLLSAVKNDRPEVLDAAYIITIVDRLF